MVWGLVITSVEGNIRLPERFVLTDLTPSVSLGWIRRRALLGAPILHNVSGTPRLSLQRFVLGTARAGSCRFISGLAALLFVSASGERWHTGEGRRRYFARGS